MGCDIYGWVEVRNKSGDWNRQIRITELTKPDYALFGLLFGVRSYSYYIPLAEERGLPDDLSNETRIESEPDWTHSHSWITWAEIISNFDNKAINDEQLELFRGTLAPEQFKSEKQLKVQDIILQRKTFYNELTKLATTYQNQNIRLVVWFDN